MDFTVHGSADQKIELAVLTGGPCSGKTETGPYLGENVPALGWHPYGAPEAAAFLIEKAKLPVKAAWQNRDMKLWLECQKTIMAGQFHWEEQAIRIAKMTGKFPALIHCDRALLDNYGYMLDACHYFGDSNEALGIFARILHETTSLTFGEACARYAVVVHMVTAADGARDFYTLADNAARDESPERAIELDGRMREAWIMHPRHAIVDNSTDFEGKKVRVLRAICGALGISAPSAGT